MQPDTAYIKQLLKQHYNLEARIASPLPGEIDLNFFVEIDTGRRYTLKIANAQENRENLMFQNTLMEHLGAAGLSLETPQPVSSLSGESIIAVQIPTGQMRLMRLLTWVEGRCFADVTPQPPALIEQVGEMCGKLSLAFDGFEHPAAQRWIKWDPSQASWTAAELHHIQDPERRELAAHFLQLFEQEAVPKLPLLRKSVCYNDANDYNILVSLEPENPIVPGVIDFGDAVYTHTLNDLAIAAAYVAMHKPDPLTAMTQLTAGYHRVFPLRENEADVLWYMVGARLLISVTCSAINIKAHPENEYLQISDEPAWRLLEQMRQISPAFARAAIRHACGMTPCPSQIAFENWAMAHQAAIHPLVDADLGKAVWLDLSVGSPDLGGYADIEDASRLDFLIQQAIREGSGGHPVAGIGRYNEIRPFYTSDAYEVRGNQGPEWRTVHIGLDIFLPPGTAVKAPLDGIIHSFQDNANDRDYGPTIILAHHIPEIKLTFYTLYGHLTRSSLLDLHIGQVIKAGTPFCQIGPMPENGNWSPHLHFQVMLDLLERAGDFPGVAFPRQRAIWTSLCPDPWLFLNGQPSPPPPPAKTIGEALDYRRQHLGKNLSLSYRQPLKMLRGWRQYLFDDTGRRYLDTVNNVAHVGHEHPRVVRAGQRQMAVLNTNTRYLHDNILAFTETLLSTFPPGLDVAFLVNSGSEANELAMRLAKTFTGRRGIVVLEHGYHGNTQGCVEVSSYKFDGPGGSGAPAHVQVAPLPDVFRGLYAGRGPEAGALYAGHIVEAIAALEDRGIPPAAFLCESVVSCGGQIPLPTDFLTGAATAIRQHGGVLIMDEVQTGCGRDGRHFWAFEAHGVVPDIVTIGKPIGNGHPLGVVVTTRTIADAFANGMEYFNTFGGNPVSSAIGLEVLRVIREEGLQENALATGEYLSQALRELSMQFPVIGDVRGPGLFIGFELVRAPLKADAAKAAYLANRMRELGILMSTDGPDHNVLKIKPPIIFSRKDADFLIEMLERVLQEDRMRG